MWIEDELKKDMNGIQETIQRFTRDYKAQLPQGIRTNLRENREKTTDFIKHFYHKLRNAEFNIYRENVEYPASQVTQRDVDNVDEVSRHLSFQISEIKNSEYDLPHPRILSELRHKYDIRQSSHGDDDKYIPFKVYTYIREKSEYCIRFQSTIHGRVITLYFVTFPESHISICNRGSSNGGVCEVEKAVYQTYAYKVFVWLYIVTDMSDKECSEKSLNVYFYMTPFKKRRPAMTASGDDAILSAIHVNTGITRNCETHGEIVVYRAEEWFKVFIHETMHNFNMDFIELDLRAANQQLRRTFCIPHEDLLLFETYTEGWARIINTMFNVYFGSSSSSSSQAHFIRSVREKLSGSSLFYAYQAVKVLNVMHLKYANITILSTENTEVCRERYTEDTNVYAYYILGGLLSVYALPFMSWCCENNRSRISAIRFSRSSGNLMKFVDFICSASRDPVMLSLVTFIEKMDTIVNNTTAMTMRMTFD